ncbi:propionyl-CoA synthetase [Simiduia agarivorans]|uniref:Acetyl-CoA synthetase n=1 Tax=Simiduia agarivorans (strain DSM 21679 / JCM 13881 / BCRC 17597 / SA1) TaxID=1117647 RepID=K4KP67_SIMAS|nr:propionyl-CoA synthetase [Simiduia agarivorans]AFU99908.2 acetyl-CoA synthetase [Simiduia agarivorans SA1 = DSM 21679]
MKYQDVYARSLQQPESYWREQASQLPWYRFPVTTLAPDDNGWPRWFPDGELNTCYMALDHHVAQGNGDQIALHYDSPVTGARQSFSFETLRDQVALCAGMLRDLGVGKGDRVVIYMPMIPEAVVAMLACARLGAIHSVVFGGFAASELAARIDDATPIVVVSASCGIEVDQVIAYKPLLDQAIDQAWHQPAHCVIVQRPQLQAKLMGPRDLDWHQALARAQPADCVPVLATDPLYILYTSGTTGKPKGVVRDNGGHAVAMHHSMRCVYNMGPGDVFWAASDVGWVVGHSYIVYAPLLAGVTSVLYEGKPVRTPDAGAFWRVIEQYQVNAIFAAPTAFRAIRKADPESTLLNPYNLASLKTVFMAGERLDPATYHWVKNLLGLPVVDHWWQTETGWAICGNPMGIEPVPPKAGSATLPMPGYDVRILDANGKDCAAGEQGSVAIKLPLPPGCLATVWGDHARFVNSYLSVFDGYYTTGDGGYKDEQGYVFIMGRTDDVINVAGHRLSTGEMEEIVAGHKAVAECAVVGVADDLKGQLPLGLVVLKDGVDASDESIAAELVQRVRDKLGAVACFKQVKVVDRLPKTRSGKILRRLIRQIADKEQYQTPSTIDDPAAIGAIEKVLA